MFATLHEFEIRYEIVKIFLNGLKPVDLSPRRPLTYGPVTKAVRGRSKLDRGQALLQRNHRLCGKTKREVGALVEDRRNFHTLLSACVVLPIKVDKQAS